MCQLFDVGPNYLVMEFVEGVPVAPVDTTRKFIDLAVQIADGLTAAHAAGIVHRDLKPDNIFVTRESRVKILDFGLAKAATALVSEADPTRTVKEDGALTRPGTAIGTIAYMSPEQARGISDLSPQSDQFSFGLVLYELAAGTRAFQRDSAAETMTAIIREEAPPLPASVPAALRWVVERLLAKDPSERYDSTRDLYRELRHIRERLSEATSPVAVPGFAKRSTRRRLFALLGIAAVMIGLVAAVAWRPVPPLAADESKYRYTPLTQEEGGETRPEFSPEGKSILYISARHGIRQVFVKTIGSPDSVQVSRANEDVTSSTIGNTRGGPNST